MADFCRLLISLPIEEEEEEDEAVAERLEVVVPAELAEAGPAALTDVLTIALACIMLMFLVKEALDSALPSSDQGTCWLTLMFHS